MKQVHQHGRLDIFANTSARIPPILADPEPHKQWFRSQGSAVRVWALPSSCSHDSRKATTTTEFPAAFDEFENPQRPSRLHQCLSTPSELRGNASHRKKPQRYQELTSPHVESTQRCYGSRHRRRYEQWNMVVITIGQHVDCVWLFRMLTCHAKFAFHVLQIVDAFSELMGVEMLPIWFKVEAITPSQDIILLNCVRFANRFNVQR